MIPIEDVKSDPGVENEKGLLKEIDFLFREESYIGYHILIVVAAVLFQFFPKIPPLVKGLVLAGIFLIIKFIFPSILYTS